MNKQTDETAAAPSNAFLHLMQNHAAGEILEELSAAQRACVEAATLRGKPASLAIAVKFTPAARGAYAVEFSEIKLKLPPLERPISLWYGDGDGNLQRDDPKQATLALKTVAEPAAEKDLKTVKAS